MSTLISTPMTRKEIEALTGLKGKELTAYLRAECRKGALVSYRRYENPAGGPKSIKVYHAVAQTMSLDLKGGA